MNLKINKNIFSPDRHFYIMTQFAVNVPSIKGSTIRNILFLDTLEFSL